MRQPTVRLLCLAVLMLAAITSAGCATNSTATAPQQTDDLTAIDAAAPAADPTSESTSESTPVAGTESESATDADAGDSAGDIDLPDDIAEIGDDIQEAVARENKEIAADPCDQFEKDDMHWLDASQEFVYDTVCTTSAWFDSFFGDRRFDDQTGQTMGRIQLNGFWDQRDGFDPKLRFRFRFALPAMRERGQFFIGRGNSDQLIDERTNEVDAIPTNFNTIEDDSFLIGLGYNRSQGLKRGFSFSVGAKLRVPPEPYAKVKYRRAWELTDSTMLAVRPILYWKLEEQFGTTAHVDLDHLIGRNFMVRWANYGNISQKETEGVEWQSTVYLFQNLTDRKAFTYSVMILGETEAEVPLRNYGVELRYRQRLFRKWLFGEIVTNLTWPQYFIDEKREPNFGIGLGVEMYFGPTPDYALR